jgi:hypothetical protein
VAERLGLRPIQIEGLIESAAHCEQCFTEMFHESSGQVRYTEHALAQATPLRQRPLCRYDYAEWNNLGFGAIRHSGNFGVSNSFEATDATELASIQMRSKDEIERKLGSYITLLDLPKASILWCARPVGPLDSVEWRVVEEFFSSWRAGELPCLPYLLQSPADTKAVVTMRLDCDEAISSARALFDLYQEEGVPFSLAVKTGQDINSSGIATLMRQTGGTTAKLHRKTPRLH